MELGTTKSSLVKCKPNWVGAPLTLTLTLTLTQQHTHNRSILKLKSLHKATRHTQHQTETVTDKINTHKQTVSSGSTLSTHITTTTTTTTPLPTSFAQSNACHYLNSMFLFSRRTLTLLCCLACEPFFFWGLFLFKQKCLVMLCIVSIYLSTF